MYFGNHLIEMAKLAAAKHGLEPALVVAICEVESGFNPLAARHEPSFRWIVKNPDKPAACTLATEINLQKTSFGLMQIMGATARDLGLKGWITILVDPETSLEWGCRYLAKLKARYGSQGTDAVIAAYNAGSPIIENGRYLNQSYVDKVKAAMK